MCKEPVDRKTVRGTSLSPEVSQSLFSCGVLMQQPGTVFLLDLNKDNVISE